MLFRSMYGNTIERNNRGRKILKKLKELFPDAHIVLKYKNAWELLVAVRLSAQCTDKKVNEIPHDHLVTNFQGIEKIVSKYLNT